MMYRAVHRRSLLGHLCSLWIPDVRAFRPPLSLFLSLYLALLTPSDSDRIDGFEIGSAALYIQCISLSHRSLPHNVS